MKKKIYCNPETEVIAMEMLGIMMEWSNQTINGNPTGDFNYGGEAGDDMEADAKSSSWDSWERVGHWED